MQPADWSLCRTFLAVLRTGSLAAAARSLGFTHPTVRRHLAELEQALGASLFSRSPSGLIPTDRALALRGPAETMEAAFEQLLRDGAASPDEVSGTVRIAASELMGVEVLPSLLAPLRAAHPALQLELALSDRSSDLLRRDADIAVRMVRPVQSTLVARRIATVELGLFAHHSWLAAHGAPASLSRLLETRQMIGQDRDQGLLDGLAGLGHAAARADFAVRCDNSLAQLAALRAGLGVGVVQVPLAARDPSLVRLLPDLRAGLEIWLVTHPDLRRSPRIAVCADMLAKGLAAYAAG